MQENNETFHYTYSADRQEEIKAIRSKYVAPEDDKMARLRRLDLRPTQKAQAWGIALGVMGALTLGTGMSLAMTDLSQSFGGAGILIGIPIGLAGIALTSLAWPVYNHILKKERKRVAPEILQLTDELMK